MKRSIGVFQDHHQGALAVLVQKSSTKAGYTAGVSLETTTDTLARLYPALSQEWFGYLNAGTPEDYVPGSRYRAWWECSSGHLFAAQIWERTVRETGCQYCEEAKHLVGSGRSLAERHPHLARQWDVRNQGIVAEQVRASSKLFAWWRCESGHEFSATVAKRVAGRAECTRCSSQGWTTSEDSSLSVLYPQAAAHWSTARNGLGADQVTASTPGLYWWECPVGHTWTSRIVAQLSAGECRQCQQNAPVVATAAPVRRPSERKALDAPAVPAPWNWEELAAEHSKEREQKEAQHQQAQSRPVTRTGGRKKAAEGTGAERKPRSASVVSVAALRSALREHKVLVRIFPAAHTLQLHSPIKVSIMGAYGPSNAVVAIEVDTKRGARDLRRTQDLLDSGVLVVRICVGVERLDLTHPNLLQLGSMSTPTALRRIGDWLRA